MGMREEFEAWYLETSDMDIRPARIDDHYVLSVHNVAWCAWQASRAALVIELPDRETYEYDAGYTVYDLCAQALTDAGVSYK
jgi:hypothetical protein